MNFRTQISLSKSNIQIDYSSRVVLLGSCFAENISEKFSYFKFQHTVNPFGIIFNPVSIQKNIERIIQKNYFTEDDVFFHNDLWHSYDVHSELSNANKQELLDALNALIDTTFLELQNASTCIITYGTSWVYKTISENEIVANCHKVPQKEFSKELLSIAEIEESISKSISLIHSVNPDCTFIFTVSPVRHLKDGFVENQLSKAHLISAIYSSISHLPTSIYFPSYEIMMDDLRDYRFYSEDMLHPNQVAIDYIWQQFKNVHLSESSYVVMDEIDSIQKGLAHRPFNPNTAQHQLFVEKLQQRIAILQKNYPFITLG